MLILDDWKAILEGLLFVAGDDGLSLKEIATVLEIEEQEVESLLAEMKQEYDQPNRGIQIEMIANKYVFTTKAEHANYYQKLIETPSHTGLSQAALETLAIIAYNQPITRVEIEEIRGVKSEKAIATLVSRLLVEDVGRAEGSGRAILYGTTEEFLNYFGLSSLEELPPLPEAVEDPLEEADLFYKHFEESIDELFNDTDESENN